MYLPCKFFKTSSIPSNNSIAFDADDTLWVNEIYFREAEEEFAELLSKYETKNKIDQELFKTEIRNLSQYGYGVKGFILSMIECALEISNYQVQQNTTFRYRAITIFNDWELFKVRCFTLDKNWSSCNTCSFPYNLDA